MTRERVAVVGAGIAGLTAAYLLRNRYDVVLFEAGSRLGGHANTESVRSSSGEVVPVDTGFIVHNGQTYPLLVRLFAELGVATRDTDMSMSVSCRECGLEYAGGRHGIHLLPHGPIGVWSPYVRTLAQIPRFLRIARQVLETPDVGSTLDDVLASGGFSRYFVDHFAIPLVSAVWSADEQVSQHYPARHLFTFLANHGLLDPHQSMHWRTVVGGSRTYVDRIAARLTDIRAATPVRTVRRHADGVEVVDAGDNTHAVSRVVLATHADQALSLLADPTPEEKQVLGAFTYTRNEVWLHTDPTTLPSARRLSGSWNYLKPRCRSDRPVVVSYHLNRLMRLTTRPDYIVTLNGAARVDPRSVLKKMVYEHPAFTEQAVLAQRSLPQLTQGRTAYAGAYHGWGFHEDGCRSGVHAAEAFGIHWS